MTKSIQAYECTECESLHKTAAAAKACRTKCLKAKEEQLAAKEKYDAENEKKLAKQSLLDYPRLNATSISHLELLLKENALKIWNIELDVKFTNINTLYASQINGTYNVPIDESGSRESIYRGFTGYIKFKVKHLTNQSSGQRRMSGSDFFETHLGFTGINIGSGGGGSASYSYGVTLFLDDFPLIKKAYEIISLKSVEADEYNSDVMDIARKKCEVDLMNISLSDDISRTQREIDELNDHIRDQRLQLTTYQNKKYYDHARELQQKKSDELTALKRSFNWE